MAATSLLHLDTTWQFGAYFCIKTSGRIDALNLFLDFTILHDAAQNWRTSLSHTYMMPTDDFAFCKKKEQEGFSQKIISCEASGQPIKF